MIEIYLTLSVFILIILTSIFKGPWKIAFLTVVNWTLHPHLKEYNLFINSTVSINPSGFWSIFLLFFSIIFLFLNKKSNNNLSKNVVFSLFCFLFSLMVSVFFVDDKLVHLRGVMHYISVGLLFAILLNHSKYMALNEIRKIFYILFIAMLSYYVLEFLLSQKLTWLNEGNYVRKMYGIIRGGNDSIGLYIFIFPFILGRKIKSEILVWFIIIISIFIVFLSYTRMAWFGFPIILFLFFMLSGKIYKMWLRILAFVAIFYIFIISEYMSIVNRISDISLSGKNTLATRINDIWLASALKVLHENPFFGLGAYWTKLNLEVETIAHNIFIEIFVWSGIIGLIFWLRFIYLIFKYDSKLVKLRDFKNSAEIAGVSCSLLAYFIWGLSANAWNPLGFFLFLLMCLYMLLMFKYIKPNLNK